MPADIVTLALRRAGQAIPLVLAIVTTVFVLTHLAPGDPLIALVGDGGTPEFMAEMRARYGLDAPLATQYWRYLVAVAGGDFGYSLSHRMPVAEVVLARLPASLALAAAATTLGVALGLVVAVLCALSPSSAIDRAARLLSAVGYALPVFWTGQLLLLVFAVRLGWFSIVGREAGPISGVEAVIEGVRHLALPAVALAVPMAAVVTRVARASLLDGTTRHVVLAARGRGSSPLGAVLRHALPMSLVPLVTLVGHQAGHLLTGAALTEAVFARPGLGQLLIDASMARDLALLLGVFLVGSLTVIGANLAADIGCLLLDPRQRHR